MSDPLSVVLFVRDACVTLVVPTQGSAFYLRSLDGAIGRRQQDVMFWFGAVEPGYEAIATQSVDEDVLAIDDIVARLAAVIEAFRSDRG